MSSKRKNTRTARPAARDHAAPVISNPPDPAPENTLSPPARTDTEAKLWEALAANPGATTAALASHAGIGASTAGKALTRWLRDGYVSRAAGVVVDGDGGGRSRAAGTWTIAVPTANEASAAADATRPDADAPDTGRSDTADTETTGAKPATTPPKAPRQDSRKARTGNATDRHAGKPDLNTNGARKLRSGQLRGQVEDALRDKPQCERSPVEFANKLGRSSGAVANALEKLTEAGFAERTSDKPKRYRLATDG